MRGKGSQVGEGAGAVIGCYRTYLEEALERVGPRRCDLKLVLHKSQLGTPGIRALGALDSGVGLFSKDEWVAHELHVAAGSSELRQANKTSSQDISAQTVKISSCDFQMGKQVRGGPLSNCE